MVDAATRTAQYYVNGAASGLPIATPAGGANIVAGAFRFNAGGYVASGAPGVEKVPRPHLPPGLELLGMEMCGEVQTPLRVPPGTRLELGDPVIFRHAKGGELCERFDSVALFAGGRIVDRVPTYRGQGRSFF